MQGNYTYAITEMLGNDSEATELVTFNYRLTESDVCTLKKELQAASVQSELNGLEAADTIYAALKTFGEKTGIVGILTRKQVIQEIIF